MQRARTEDQKDKRRSALLDAALDEFFERGFMAARMDDIARRANLSKGAVYLYFNSKEELFTSLIDLHAKPNVQKLASMVETAPSFRYGIRLLASNAPSIIRETKIPRLLKILIGDATHFPDSVRQYRQQVIDYMLAALSGLLERGVEIGEIDVRDIDSTTRLIVAPVVLASVWQVVFATVDPETQMDLDALFNEHLRLIERALNASPGLEGKV